MSNTLKGKTYAETNMSRVFTAIINSIKAGISELLERFQQADY